MDPHSFQIKTNAEWDQIYQKTLFQVRDLDGELISFKAQTAEQHPFLKMKVFAIITAFNPMNQKASDEENHKQNQALCEDLGRTGYLFYATKGMLEGHIEDSFTVENISQSHAIEIGVKYRQHSILYNDAQGVRFVRCCHA